MQPVVALDLGTTCGWAMSYSGSSVDEHGVWDLSVDRHQSPAMRLIKLTASLDELARRIPKKKDVVPVVTWCKPIFVPKKGRGVSIGFELGGQVKVFAHNHGWAWSEIKEGEVKKFATGKGNAKKELLMSALKDTLGIDVEGRHDECDAIWVLQFTIKEVLKA